VQQWCTSSLTITLKSKAPKSINNKNKYIYSMSFGRRKKINCGDADADSLFDAVETGDLAEVKRLVVGCGVDPNVREDDYGATPLDAVAEYGYSEIVEFLLEHGADPNIRDKYGSTPLLYAAMFGNSKVVEVLLEHGADPNIRNKNGFTPLHYAAAFDYPKIVETLHKEGLSDDDITPLKAAAEFNYPEVVKLLLEHGANPNIQDYKYGWTPLHFAVSLCHVDVARVLLDHGADPTIRDNEGRTPLDIGSNCEEIIEELRRRSGGTTVYE